jgi:hypothetical protein
MYEVYKSNYDDLGKIIKVDRSRTGLGKAMSSNSKMVADALSSRSSVFEGRQSN